MIYTIRLIYLSFIARVFQSSQKSTTVVLLKTVTEQ